MNKQISFFFGFCFTLIVLLLSSCSSIEPNVSNRNSPAYTNGMSNNQSAVSYYKEAYKKVEIKAYSEAIDLYSKAISLDPNFPAAYTNRGNVYGFKGSLSDALRDHSKAIKIDKYFPRAYFNRGGVYAKLGRTRKAISDYDTAINLKPQYPRAYAHRGYMFDKLGKKDKAPEGYNKAIELKFEDSNTYYNRGGIYLRARMGDYGEADFIKATELDSQNFRAFYNLACKHSLKNDTDKTLYYLKKAKTAGFNDLDFLKRDSDLKNFRKTHEYKEFLDSF